ncbi:hypothetical protein [Streptomyces sp. 2A115]|uniref:hypothetical protein n=1 Tax=Streptomyces sp. 2A115 TaxID=3457439 RepID=UPI003FCF042A
MPEENPDPLAALALAASTQLVAAMSTDTWTAMRESVARLLNRTDSAQIQEAVDAFSAQPGDTAPALASRGPDPETMQTLIRQVSPFAAEHATNAMYESLTDLLARIKDRQPTDEAAPEDVSAELLDTLTDSAAAFAQSQPSGMSWETKRTLFLWFWGILVFIALVQAQVQSDSVKELIEDAGGAVLIVGPTVAGAAYAWNKIHPNPDSDNDEDGTA